MGKLRKNIDSFLRYNLDIRRGEKVVIITNSESFGRAVVFKIAIREITDSVKVFVDFVEVEKIIGNEFKDRIKKEMEDRIGKADIILHISNTKESGYSGRLITVTIIHDSRILSNEGNSGMKFQITAEGISFLSDD